MKVLRKPLVIIGLSTVAALGSLAAVKRFAPATVAAYF